jgi:hypothetical protein
MKNSPSVVDFGDGPKRLARPLTAGSNDGADGSLVRQKDGPRQ